MIKLVELEDFVYKELCLYSNLKIQIQSARVQS